MTRMKIIDRALMKERLTEKMRQHGMVHQNGSPFQLKLAEASGVSQPTISALLSGTLQSIKETELKKLTETLECQEQWLIGGAYIPPLFIKKEGEKEIYTPEQKIEIQANTEATGPLWAIVRQLQRLNDNIERLEYLELNGCLRKTGGIINTTLQAHIRKEKK